jgi:hypothetical protein
MVKSDWGDPVEIAKGIQGGCERGRAPRQRAVLDPSVKILEPKMATRFRRAPGESQEAVVTSMTFP